MIALLALLKRIPIWLYVGAGLAALLGIQTLRLHFADSNLAVAKAQEAAYVSAQVTNLATIQTQQTQLASWQSKFATGIAAAHATAQLAVASAIESDHRAHAAQQQLKVIYEHSPASVRACGPVAVPPAGVVQLRDIAGRPH